MKRNSNRNRGHGERKFLSDYQGKNEFYGQYKNRENHDQDKNERFWGKPTYREIDEDYRNKEDRRDYLYRKNNCEKPEYYEKQKRNNNRNKEDRRAFFIKKR